MSIPVPLAELNAALADYGAAYLLTVSGSGGPHAVAVAPELVGDALVVTGVGRRTGANVAASPAVTLLWPPRADGGYSLIVDGRAVMEVDRVRVVPQRAVLHRPAPRTVGESGTSEAGCTSDCVELPVSAPNG